MAKTILVNINRCTGCWTCSMACKTANKLEVDEFRQYVRTIGGGERDEPGGEWPNLYMKWMPIWKLSCTSCRGDWSTDGKPFCTYNCPTGALTYGDLEDETSEIAQYAGALKENSFRFYEIPEWEETRSGIVYAEKGI